MKISSIILLTVLSLNLYGQTNDDPTGMKLFNRGVEHYQNGNFDSTLIIWTKIVEEKIAIQYDTYGNAFFNIPSVYWKLENYEKAKEWYKKILTSNLRDSEETGSLMEPHANYKHKSAMALASLYQMDSNYTEVLYWLNQADTVYRYWGYEGNATSVSLNQASLLQWKTAILGKLNRKNEAIRTILTELICADKFDNYFRASEDTLLTLVDKKLFKLALDNSLNKIKIKDLNENNWVAVFSINELTYEIPISNVYPNKNLPHYWTIYFIDKSTVPVKQDFINDLKNCSFYKRLED